jgi:hypothetical protein
MNKLKRLSKLETHNTKFPPPIRTTNKKHKTAAPMTMNALSILAFSAIFPTCSSTTGTLARNSLILALTESTADADILIINESS